MRTPEAEKDDLSDLWVVTVSMAGTVQLEVEAKNAEEAVLRAKEGRWLVYLPKTVRDWSQAKVERLAEDIG